jgi:hypothetical protein
MTIPILYVWSCAVGWIIVDVLLVLWGNPRLKSVRMNDTIAVFGFSMVLTLIAGIIGL